jgi:hypothetical protein
MFNLFILTCILSLLVQKVYSVSNTDTAVLVVNGYNEFFGTGKMSVSNEDPGASKLMNFIRSLDRNIPIIVTVKPGLKTCDNSSNIYYPELIDGLHEKADYFIVKGYNSISNDESDSAFQNEEFNGLLREIGCKNLIIVGERGDKAPKYSMIDALKLKYNVIHIKDMMHYPSKTNLRHTHDELLYEYVKYAPKNAYGLYVAMLSHDFLKYQDSNISTLINIQKKIDYVPPKYKSVNMHYSSKREIEEAKSWKPFYTGINSILYGVFKFYILIVCIGIIMLPFSCFFNNKRS